MKTLYQGSSGYDVYLAKLALFRAIGYDKSFTDFYTEDFENTVKEFQRAKGLKADGIFGPDTWQSALPFLYGFTIHTVVTGDTIDKLSEYYSTTQNAILKANPDISDAENLKLGYRLVVPYNFPLVTDKIPYSFMLTQFILYGLIARYPFLELSKIGNSIMGKSLYYVKIGRGAKEYFYNASHHANEWITTPLLLKFLEEYSKAYSDNLRINNQGATFL